MSRTLFFSSALSYDKICDKWYAFRKETVLNSCIADFMKQIKKGGTVLDVGCGTGYPISFFLSKQGFTVTGIDLSDKMLEKARTLSLEKATFLKADLMTFQTNTLFDAVIAFDSLWHIPFEKQREIYPVLASLTRPGGLLLFTHGNKEGETTGTMYGEPFYYSALNTEEVQALLSANGFEIVQCRENYEEKTTGTRDLLIVAKKSPAAF